MYLEVDRTWILIIGTPTGTATYRSPHKLKLVVASGLLFGFVLFRFCVGHCTTIYPKCVGLLALHVVLALELMKPDAVVLPPLSSKL